MEDRALARTWKDIVGRFLKLGATAYGGPAIMGIMQAEIQERRQWVTKERARRHAGADHGIRRTRRHPGHP